MKMCFINAPVGTINESQEVVIYQMAENLCEKHNVTVITGRSRSKPLLKRIENAPFNVVTVPFWPRRTSLNNFFSRVYKRLHPWKIESITFYIGVMLRPSVKRVIKEADVVLTWYRLDSRLFSNFAYKHGIPCLSNFQFAGFGKKFFDVDKSVMYIANSIFSKDSLERKLGVKIHGAITPGVSSEFFDENQPIIPEIKSHKSLLFVGHLHPEKGVFELINVFKEISKKHEDSMLFIVGSGETEDMLNEKLKTLDLSDRVVFVGEVSYEVMPSYYRSATILIHPTHMETFGMVILEAMASGLPVIASDIPALREVTEGTAILLPLDDLNLWIEKIDYLLKNEKARTEMAKKGIKKAKQHLWEKKAVQLERYLEKAAQHKGKL